MKRLLKVPATKSALISLKRQSHFLAQGHDMLERKRELPSADWDATQKGAVLRGLDVMEEESPAWGEGFTIGQITAAVSLGYLDFRFGDEDWRPSHPGLAEWYAVTSQRPSMLGTIPKAP